MLVVFFFFFLFVSLSNAALNPIVRVAEQMAKSNAKKAEQQQKTSQEQQNKWTGPRAKLEVDTMMTDGQAALNLMGDCTYTNIIQQVSTQCGLEACPPQININCNVLGSSTCGVNGKPPRSNSYHTMQSFRCKALISNSQFNTQWKSLFLSAISKPGDNLSSMQTSNCLSNPQATCLLRKDEKQCSNFQLPTYLTFTLYNTSITIGNQIIEQLSIDLSQCQQAVSTFNCGSLTSTLGWINAGVGLVLPDLSGTSTLITMAIGAAAGC